MRTKIRRRPNGRWYVYAIDDAGDERGHGGYRTQKEAKAAAKALEVDASRGRYVSPAKMSVASYLAEWVQARENADLSPGTRAVERVMVSSWIVPYIGEIPLQKLKARDLDGLYAALRARPLKGKSVRNAHVLLHKALGDAVRRGHVLANVADAVSSPAKDDSAPRSAWSAEEARAFLAVAASDRLGAVWRLALASGMRRGELCGLKWPNVDGSRISVHRQVLVRPTRTWDQDRVYVRGRRSRDVRGR